MSPAAGWYADPGVPGRLRWWDGTRWTEHVTPDPNATSAQEASASAGAEASGADVAGTDGSSSSRDATDDEQAEAARPTAVSGWYADPSGVAGQLRWWDGARWTAEVAQDPSFPAGGGTAEPSAEADDDPGVETAALSDRPELEVDTAAADESAAGGESTESEPEPDLQARTGTESGESFDTPTVAETTLDESVELDPGSPAEVRADHEVGTDADATPEAASDEAPEPATDAERANMSAAVDDSTAAGPGGEPTAEPDVADEHADAEADVADEHADAEADVADEPVDAGPVGPDEHTDAEVEAADEQDVAGEQVVPDEHTDAEPRVAEESVGEAVTESDDRDVEASSEPDVSAGTAAQLDLEAVPAVDAGSEPGDDLPLGSPRSATSTSTSSSVDDVDDDELAEDTDEDVSDGRSAVEPETGRDLAEGTTPTLPDMIDMIDADGSAADDSAEGAGATELESTATPEVEDADATEVESTATPEVESAEPEAAESDESDEAAQVDLDAQTEPSEVDNSAASAQVSDEDVSAGWYPDPSGVPDQLRWWDGVGWTDTVTPDPLAGAAAAEGGVETHDEPHGLDVDTEPELDDVAPDDVETDESVTAWTGVIDDPERSGEDADAPSDVEQRSREGTDGEGSGPGDEAGDDALTTVGDAELDDALAAIEAITRRPLPGSATSTEDEATTGSDDEATTGRDDGETQDGEHASSVDAPTDGDPTDPTAAEVLAEGVDATTDGAGTTPEDEAQGPDEPGAVDSDVVEPADRDVTDEASAGERVHDELTSPDTSPDTGAGDVTADVSAVAEATGVRDPAEITLEPSPHADADADDRSEEEIDGVAPADEGRSARGWGRGGRGGGAATEAGPVEPAAPGRIRTRTIVLTVVGVVTLGVAAASLTGGGGTEETPPPATTETEPPAGDPPAGDPVGGSIEIGEAVDAEVPEEGSFEIDVIVAAGGQVTLDIRAVAEGWDPVAELTDLEGITVAYNDDRGETAVDRVGGGYYDPLIVTDLDPGTYRLIVRGFAQESGPFELRTS